MRLADIIDINVDSRPGSRRDAAITQEVRMTDGTGDRGRPAGSKQDSADRGPLAGVRGLGLTSGVMGPLATQILGDLGADLITVETPGGDINRIIGPGPRPGFARLA